MDIKQYKITVFGDSICEGVVTEGNSIKRIEDNAVGLIANHFGVTIDNKGTYGMTLSRLNTKGAFDKYLQNIDLTQKNVVVLAIGGNDSDFDWKKIDANPLGEHIQKTPLTDFSRLMTETIDKLTSKGVRVVLMTMPPMNPFWYIDNFLTKFASKQNIMTFLKGDALNMYRDQERYSAEIMRVAVTTDCELIDLRSLLLLNTQYNDLLCADGIHPNQKGQRHIANTIIDIIENKQIYNKIY